MVITGALLLALLFAPPEDYGAEGLKALDANQPAAAEPLFRKAVEADPTDLQSQFNLALVFGMEGKNAEAIAAYRKTLELKPGLFEADLNLGILLLRNKQSADALTVLREAAEIKPGDYRAQLNYGNSLYDTGSYEQSEKSYRQALTIDSKSAIANLGVARSLLKQNRLSESEPFYRAAASLDAAYRNNILELGAGYDQAGNSAQAIAIFREFPANEPVAKRLTELLLQTNHAVEAIPGLEAAVQRAPTTANRMALIDAYRQAGQTAKVPGQLQLAVTADPANFELRMSYGRALRDKRQFEEAARQFDAAAKVQPDSAMAWNEIAGVRIILGQAEEGIAALDHVRALGKEIPGDFYLRAITLDKLRRLKPALEAYQQFLALANGKSPDEEFLARQRVRIIEDELKK